MVDKPSKSLIYLRNIPALLCWLCVLFVVAVFFFAKIYDANNKPFWIDEVYALQGSIGNHSMIYTLINGASGQASPAPLDFLACKLLALLKDKVAYFGFTREVYFRLFANGITALSCLLIILFFWIDIIKEGRKKSIQYAQLFLLLCLPFAYLFSRQVYYYASEMRPYALWNSLFMFVLAASLLDQKRKTLFIIFLVLLAFSASAAIFQLAAILFACIVAYFLNDERYRDSLKLALKLFIIPVLISVYYILRTEKFDVAYVGGGWGDFLSLWSHKAVAIPIMLLLLALCVLNKENRKYIIAPLAFLVLFLAGPLIFMITRWRGYFYAERQFIYYDLTLTVIIITLIKCLPAYVGRIRYRPAFVAVILSFCLTGALFTFKPKLIRNFNKSQIKAINAIMGNLESNKSKDT